MIEFHPAANLFPLMEGAEYFGSSADGRYLTIKPSAYPGFWFCSLISGYEEYLRRPIREDGIPLLFAYWKVSALDFNWRVSACKPPGYSRSAPTETVIYFIEAKELRRVKIGLSKDVEGRLSTLQNACPVGLVVLGVIPGNEKQERCLHRQFAHLRRHGEWFESTPELREFINTESQRL